MNDDLTPEQKFAAEDAESTVPRALLAGRALEDIVADLVALDWTPRAAQAFVQKIQDDLRRLYSSEESRRQLAREARWQIMGGILAATFSAAFTLLAIFLFGFVFFCGLPLMLGFVAFASGLAIAARGRARMRLLRSKKLPFAPTETTAEETRITG